MLVTYLQNGSALVNLFVFNGIAQGLEMDVGANGGSGHCGWHSSEDRHSANEITSFVEGDIGIDHTVDGFVSFFLVGRRNVNVCRFLVVEDHQRVQLPWSTKRST